MIDEGPSQEDIKRFSGAGGYCPACGEEIYDDVEHCPQCGEWIRGATQSRHPAASEFRKKMITIIAIVTLLAFLGLFGALRIF